MHDANTNLVDALRRYASHRRLSPRQVRILFEYMRGRNDKQIALDLGCMESTVYEHWRRMAQKCGAQLKSGVVADFHAFVWSGPLEGMEGR